MFDDGREAGEWGDCVKNIRSITHSIHFFAKTINNYA